MGKLAQRYGDAERSGLYRVRDAAIPRAAAVEANACLLEFGVEALADGAWPRVAEAIGEAGVRACVLVVPDAAALAHPGQGAVLAMLREAARSCREARCPFFAVLVDPDARLPFPPLYHERDAR